MEQFIRTALLIGQENIERLQEARVAVFGIGGVGGHAVEALVRAGIGHIDIIDNDTVAVSNLNRQLIATLDTIGKNKVDVMKERILSINAQAEVTAHQCFFLPETKDMFDFSKYDYVVDAIDMVSSKIHLVEECIKRDIPIISSMGMGNKLDPTKIEVSDISKTHTCPLAKVVRKELRDRDIEHLKVVFSAEHPLEVKEKVSNGHRILPGSIAFMSPVGGLVLASEVVKDILNINQ